MFNKTETENLSKRELYSQILTESPHYWSGHWLTALSNSASYLFQHLPDINWVGFYLLNDKKLILGPFQGKPACTEIQIGRGVCGAAAKMRQTIRVHDVDQFPDHIVCDSHSRSEIVIPLLHNGQLKGVLDVDSPIVGRFDFQDQLGLEQLSALLMQKIKFPDQIG